MLAYLALDPALFAAHNFVNDARYASDLERVLRSVHHGGCVVVDPEHTLLRAILAQIGAIPQPFRQRIQILFEELNIGRRGKARIVTCSSHVTNKTTHTGILCDLVVNCSIDGVACDTDTYAELSVAGAPAAKCSTPAQFELSEFENRRTEYLETLALNRLSEDEANDRMQRIFRFARVLRVFDRQIGQANNNVGFRDGLDYLFEQWALSSHYSLTKCHAEIITAVARSPRRNLSARELATLRHNNGIKIAQVEQEVIAPLREKYPVSIRFEVREDPSHEWHARFVETDNTVVKIDPGTDMKTRRGRFKRVYLDSANQHHEDLAAIYSLPKITYKSDGSWVI